ncbi:uncharacterized protein with FMN-binding domain [Microbacterium halimionae]|uniref:Uncharacterized protein with FMN-binding domain n=1 Tax=Microbacterium halimionae TaxID=1526413 RepID=A0A7W3PKR9_9MICO|nr:FMN-binding protein [Microbacterium halimionae]MBA8815790.1 uncharacterized protein with FMN-binding domain [Microbacterium halimionae]NII95836.1 uncharacterized protein with FMN-binding domain [Microbacterium halimionae]
MIRSTIAPRPVRVAAALASVAGLVALAGCSTTDTSTTTDSAAATPESSAAAGSNASSGTYDDGTYTAEGTYQTPESVETISVTVTLADNVITDVEVTGDPQARESQQYQSEFIGGIADVVEGKNIDDISVSRVAGSSLTSSGFNSAIEEIKSEAAA